MNRLTATMFSLPLLWMVACATVPANIVEVTPLPSDYPSATEAPATAEILPSATATLAESLPSPIASTATPLSVDLDTGESRARAMATDMALIPSPQTPLTFTDYPVELTFAEFYQAVSPRLGLVMTDKLLSLDNQQVAIEGYMAPPLKPELDWFVLTKTPLLVCPFCSTDADWPDEIALAYMPPQETLFSTTRPLRLIGTLQVGRNIDAETGMVSLVRVYVERVEEIN